VNNEIKYGDVDFDCNKRLVANYTFIASTLLNLLQNTTDSVTNIRDALATISLIIIHSSALLRVRPT